jgi:hypothetical protein
MNDVKHIVPKIVICLDMLLKATLTSFAVVVKDELTPAADVADVLHVELVLLDGVS